MKKSVYLVIFLSGISMQCFCQRKGHSEGFLGTTQGITFSRMDFKDNRQLYLYPGYTGGIMFIYTSQPNVGIRLEFNYIQKGWKIVPDSSEYYSRRMSYYEVPFMTHIIIGKSKSRFLIDLGPYGSYLNEEEEKTNIISDTLAYAGYQSNRKFDFGYCLGIGYEYITRIGNFGIEARYYNSLTNIFIPSSEIQYFSSRHQVLSIGIKYSIRLFK